MPDLMQTQTCPYCGQEVEDEYAVWDYEAGVECDQCNKEYIVKPQYQFQGFQIEKQCKFCGEFTEDGERVCLCIYDSTDE